MRSLVLISILCVAGCAEFTQTSEDLTRRSAKATVSKVLATQLPDPVRTEAITPYTDCVIDNASGSEIRNFATDAVTGVDEATVALVTLVLERPETQRCIANVALAAVAS